jgi:hypothetical protein
MPELSSAFALDIHKSVFLVSTAEERTNSLELEAAPIWRNIERRYGPNCAGIGSEGIGTQLSMFSTTPFLWVHAGKN